MKSLSRKIAGFLVLYLVATLLVVGLSFSKSQAGEIMDRILRRGTLVVGTTGHFPPFTVKDREGKYIGFDMQLANYMARLMGVKLEVKTYTMEDLLKAVKKKKVDMALAGITMTSKRNLHVVFVGPYTVTGQAILAPKSVVESIHSPADMNNPGFKLVVVKGTTGAMVAKNLVPKATIIKTDNMTQALDLVLTHKANALMTDLPFCVVAAFLHKDQDLSVSEPFTYEPVGIALPDGDYLLVNWVQNFLLKLNASGELKEMKKFWFSNPSWIESLPDKTISF